jgi:hypothetical protein
MKVKITATAPTSYQLTSLGHFGLPIKSSGDGSHYAEWEFDTLMEAKAYLKQRADMYGDDALLGVMYSEIDRVGKLRLDAVTASIVEIEDASKLQAFQIYRDRKYTAWRREKFTAWAVSKEDAMENAKSLYADADDKYSLEYEMLENTSDDMSVEQNGWMSVEDWFIDGEAFIVE